MALLYLAWKHGGHDPYRLYNHLDERYRRAWDPDGPACPPPRPERVRNVIYGFAALAQEEAAAHTSALIARGAGG